jgi:hypothetical protein
MGGNQAFDQRQNRIAGAGDAKQNFITRIIKLESRTQSLGDVIIDATQRTHQADQRVLGE